MRRDAGSWTLDLHGLSTGAAQQAVLWWLEEIQRPLLQVMGEAANEERRAADYAWRTHDIAVEAAASRHERAVEVARTGAAQAMQLCIIVGKGNHRESRWWSQHDKALEEASESVQSAVTSLLAEAHVPLLPTDGNSGSIAIDLPRWVNGEQAQGAPGVPSAGGGGLASFQQWVDAQREQRANEFRRPQQED